MIKYDDGLNRYKLTTTNQETLYFKLKDMRKIGPDHYLLYSNDLLISIQVDIAGETYCKVFKKAAKLIHEDMK